MSTYFNLLITIAALWLLALQPGLSPKLQKRVHKEIAQVFQVTDFNLKAVEVTEAVNKDLPSKISGSNFFMIEHSGSQLGYVYLDKAPSKTAEFDYMVIFDSSLEIIHSKVLVYREEYGGEIGSKRWLKQFLGKTAGDRVCTKTNIDAISGATISVRSMTHSMDKLLQTIGILEEKNIL